MRLSRSSVSPRAFAKAIPSRRTSRDAAGPSKLHRCVAEVVVEQGDLASLPGLGGERDRLAEVVEPRGVPRPARAIARKPRARAGAVEAELLGESRAPVRRTRIASRVSPAGHRRRRPRSARRRVPGRAERFQERERLRGERPLTRVPEHDEHAAQRAHRAGCGGDVASSRKAAIASSSAALASAKRPACRGGLAEAGERRRHVLGVPRGRARAPARGLQRGGGVEAERPLSGQDEEPQRRCLELCGLARFVRQRGRVRGPSRSGRRGRRRDPRRARGPSTRSTGPRRHAVRPWRPSGAGVGDVAGEDVPEGVLGLTLASRSCGRVARAPCARARAGSSVTSPGRVRPSRDRSGPEDLADRPRHRRASTSRSGARVSRRAAISAWTESGNGTSAPSRSSQLEPFPDDQVLVLQQPHELLGVQGVATRPLQDRLLEFGGDNGRLEQSRDQACGLCFRERGQVDRGGVAQSAAK